MTHMAPGVRNDSMNKTVKISIHTPCKIEQRGLTNVVKESNYYGRVISPKENSLLVKPGGGSAGVGRRKVCSLKISDQGEDEAWFHRQGKHQDSEKLFLLEKKNVCELINFLL